MPNLTTFQFCWMLLLLLWGWTHSLTGTFNRGVQVLVRPSLGPTAIFCVLYETPLLLKAEFSPLLVQLTPIRWMRIDVLEDLNISFVKNCIAPWAQHYLRILQLTYVEKIYQFLFGMWIHHLNFFSILWLKLNLHGLAGDFSSLDNQAFNWFSVMSIFDLQRVIIHLHRSLGFVAKFQSSLFQCSLY